ncbi:MAG: peptidylprolyl isomerase [Polyangiaceae bacterium]|nr:peptidylprolyl isomerase [Polyangiaceae bacterium]
MRQWTLRIIGLVFGAGILALAVLRPAALGFDKKPAPPAKEPPKIAKSEAAIPSAPQAAAVAPAGPRKDRFSTLEDGAPVPSLPADAPRGLRFGVILFPYAGAELAEADAPTRAVAFAKASAVIPEARADFAAAVKKGDRGSVENAGRIEQGVLEPSVEYAVFRLRKGEVSEVPIDTPRGFWVVRRHD